MSRSAGVFYNGGHLGWTTSYHEPLNSQNDGTGFIRAVQSANSWRENYHKVSLATHMIQNNWFDALRFHPERIGFLHAPKFTDLNDRQRAVKLPDHWTKAFDKADTVMYQLLRVIDLHKVQPDNTSFAGVI
jgi:hypothetical protein